MAVIVYGRKSSANVQKVIWICTEVGISFETRDIGGKYGGNKSDIFFNINPNGRIPVLDYNNFIIYESNAIIKFISETYAFLNSNNIKLNALINQWIDWGSFTFGVPCQLLTAHMAHLPIEKRDPNKVIEAKNIINEMLKILDQQLSQTNYLVGNDFDGTVAFDKYEIVYNSVESTKALEQMLKYELFSDMKIVKKREELLEKYNDFVSLNDLNKMNNGA